MTRYVALLRAVNVGGTGKLAMADLRVICEAAGFSDIHTYIASGNVVFVSEGRAAAVGAALERGLLAHCGKAIGVIIRDAAEMAAVLERNPFPNAPANRVMTIFLDQDTTQAMLDRVIGRSEDEEIRLGLREIYVRYGSGMGRSKLRIPAAEHGTARNMNTVAKLAAMAAGLS